MLPTTGFFKDIECPYHNSTCGRPYCHFRHRKKNSDPSEEAAPSPIPVVPTYKPTPKSQLANTRTHIPITYVPDVVVRSDRNRRKLPPFSFESKPTYNPTPLSMLPTTNKISQVDENLGAISKQTNASYNDNAESDSNDADDRQASSDDNQCGDDNGLDSYSANGGNAENEPKEIDFEDLLNEFEMIDEILTSSNEIVEEPEVKPVQKHSSSKHRSREKKSSSKSNDKKHRQSENKDKKSVDKSKLKSGEKASRSDDTKRNSKSSSHKADSKSSGDKSDKASRSKSEKSENSSKSSSRGDRKNEKSEKRDEKSEKRDEKSEKRDEKSEKRSEKRDKSSSEIKEKNSEFKEKSSELRDKSSSEHRDKTLEFKEKGSERDKSSSEKKDKSASEKSKSHKQKSRDKDRPKSKSDSEHKDRHRSEKESKRRDTDCADRPKDKTREIAKNSRKEKTKDSKSRQSDEGICEDAFEAQMSEDEIDDIEAECYRIFNEYKSSVPEYVPQETNKTEATEVEYIPTKKRIAYDKAEMHVQKLSYTKPNSHVAPAQMMANRFKEARSAQANSEQFNIMNEINKGTKRIAHSTIATRDAKVQKLAKVHRDSKGVNSTIKSSVKSAINSAINSANLIDDILSSKAKPINIYTITGEVRPKPRIAPVQNVNSMQKAKARILEVKLKTPMGTFTKKTVQMNVKGAKRVAHIPDVSLSDIPDVLKAEKSKLPVNVRTRYLTTIADECIKLYLSKEDAYERALTEELKCYEKCSALITYRNSAMLAVNRLRKELQERESSGLGPIASGEVLHSDSGSNRKGRTFYESLTPYLLTEEDLLDNGYPRESETYGRAIIKSRKSNRPTCSEQDSQRICCRCGKLYLVDVDGFALFGEECLYHPLKKRTLRGERNYLCCKSSEDTGCVTSNTHVSEIDEEHVLEGYQMTMDPDREDDPRNYSVYALDCEMCYTTKGLELTRVTIVDSECKTVYESLVKPINPIIDYNTRFSGITQDQMDRTSTSILQVQANILHLCNSKTILIGHSLESDMKALKIIHSTVIDTAIVFPHKFGLPHKRALRVLASDYLKKIIQNDINGHDSAEDAITCMELVVWKLKEDLKVRGIKLKN